MLARSFSTDGQRLASPARRADPIRTGAHVRSREGGVELERAAGQAGGLGTNARALLGVLGFDFRGGAEDFGKCVHHGYGHRRGGVQHRGDDSRREPASNGSTAHAHG